MKPTTLLPIAILTYLLTTGCAISEDDRCASGYEWDDTYRMCLKVEPEDTEPEEEIDTEPQPNGVGTLCETDTECSDLELDVNFCLINPTTPDAGGICSINDCISSDCTGPYMCCDCSSAQSDLFSADEPFCLPNDYVSVVQAFGCTCE